MTNKIMKQEQKHTLNHHHFKNGLSYMFLFLLFLSLPNAAAQNNTQWGYEDNPYSPSNDMFSTTMGIALVISVIALFFFGFSSIFLRNCNSRGSITFRGRGGMSRRGLDPAAIETLPTFTYSYVKDHHLGKGALECAVCLTEFEDHDTLRLLPKCDHVFHPECIDAWLCNRTTCPVCRDNLDSATGFSIHDMEDEIAISEPGDVENQHVESEAPQAVAAAAAESRTKPTRAKFMGIFPRSNSTGHSLVQPGEDFERFTLRLPDEVRKHVMSMRQLNRTRSMVTLNLLPTVASSRKGYRMTGEESSRGGRSMWEKPENWVLSMTPSFLMRSSKMTAEGRAPATPPRPKPFRSPLRAVNKASGAGSSSTRPPV